LRIIHVFDTAGVACILAKHQSLAGHDARVLWSNDVVDKYGIYDFYKDYMKLYSNSDFTDRLIKECIDADIIHVHANIYALMKLRKALGSEKKIILHYHGTDIRGLKREKVPFLHRSFESDAKILSKFVYRKVFRKLILSKAHKLADRIFMSQIDLLRLVPNSVYIPISVDTSHFNSGSQDLQSRKKAAVTIKTEVTDMQLVLDYYKKNDMTKALEVYDRTRQPIMYRDMPLFLKRYETYVDIRFVNRKILGDLSSTALQSLACGLNVISYDLSTLDSLPVQHKAPQVASKVLGLYEELLKR
jgi:hypothetical protein